jgi:hypothetical protein
VLPLSVNYRCKEAELVPGIATFDECADECVVRRGGPSVACTFMSFAKDGGCYISRTCAGYEDPATELTPEPTGNAGTIRIYCSFQDSRGKTCSNPASTKSTNVATLSACMDNCASDEDCHYFSFHPESSGYCAHFGACGGYVHVQQSAVQLQGEPDAYVYLMDDGPIANYGLGALVTLTDRDINAHCHRWQEYITDYGFDYNIYQLYGCTGRRGRRRLRGDALGEVRVPASRQDWAKYIVTNTEDTSHGVGVDGRTSRALAAAATAGGATTATAANDAVAAMEQALMAQAVIAASPTILTASPTAMPVAAVAPVVAPAAVQAAGGTGDFVCRCRDGYVEDPRDPFRCAATY